MEEESSNWNPMGDDEEMYDFHQKAMSWQGNQRVRSSDKNNQDNPLRHQSMAYVMSIQSDKKSDIYQRIICLEQVRRSSNNRKSQHDNSQISKPSVQNARRSGVQKKTFHTCLCQDQCEDILCSCFYAKDEICIKGICCQKCISLKLNFMNKNKGCVCKSSKCLKSYCKCYFNDNSCGRDCKCTGCQNTIQKRKQEKQKAKRTKKVNLNKVQKKSLPSATESDKDKIQIESNQVLSNQTCCSCRKTKCKKKYCSCYFNGGKCSKYCGCIRCQNPGEDYYQGRQMINQEQIQEYLQSKQRHGRHDDQEQQDEEGNENKAPKQYDISQYLNDFEEEQPVMPKQMTFQPIDFSIAVQRYKNQMKNTHNIS